MRLSIIFWFIEETRVSTALRETNYLSEGGGGGQVIKIRIQIQFNSNISD